MCKSFTGQCEEQLLALCLCADSRVFRPCRPGWEEALWDTTHADDDLRLGSYETTHFQGEATTNIE